MMKRLSITCVPSSGPTKGSCASLGKHIPNRLSLHKRHSPAGPKLPLLLPLHTSHPCRRASLWTLLLAVLHGARCCPVLEKALSWNFLFAGNTFLLESTFSFLFNGILHLSRQEARLRKDLHQKVRLHSVRRPSSGPISPAQPNQPSAWDISLDDKRCTRPFSVNLETAIRGFDIDNVAAQKAIDVQSSPCT